MRNIIPPDDIKESLNEYIKRKKELLDKELDSSIELSKTSLASATKDETEKIINSFSTSEQKERRIEKSVIGKLWNRFINRNNLKDHKSENEDFKIDGNSTSSRD